MLQGLHGELLVLGCEQDMNAECLQFATQESQHQPLD